MPQALFYVLGQGPQSATSAAFLRFWLLLSLKDFVLSHCKDLKLGFKIGI